jgi:hypothetical protein
MPRVGGLAGRQGRAGRAEYADGGLLAAQRIRVAGALRTNLTWSLALESVSGDRGRTRVFLRLRMAPVRHKLLARTAGELIDVLTVAGMVAGLAERLRGREAAA